MQDLIKQNVSRGLDHGSRVLKTDLKYIAKGSFWLSIGTVGSVIIGILSSMAFARFLPQYEYGVYKFILSVFGFFSIFTLSGVGVAISQAIARGYDKNIFEAFRIQNRWNFFVSLAILAVSIYYFINKNNVLGVSFLIVAITFSMMISPLLYNNYLEGKKLFKQKTIYQLIVAIVTTLISVGVILLTDNIILLIISYFVSYSFFYMYFYGLTLRKYPPQGLSDTTSIKFGNHLSILNALGSIGSHLDAILLFHFLGAQALAIYSFAILPINNLLSLKKNLRVLIDPKFTNRTVIDIKSAIWRKFVQLEIFVILIIIVYIFAAPYIFQFLFPAYLDAVFYSQVAVMLMIFVPRILFNQTFQTKERKKELYIINISTTTLRIILLAIFIPIWGIIGAIGAWIVAMTYNFFAMLYFFIKLKD